VDGERDPPAVLRLIARVTAAALALAPLAAWPHHPGAVEPLRIEPWGAACLAVSAVAYAWGVGRLWRRAGAFRGISRGDAARFAAGWLLLCAALLPPIDTMAAVSFAAHMAQHEILMALAAPLLVLGRPLEAWVWALSPAGRARIPMVTCSRVLRNAWAAITSPLGAWLLHAAALWIWHVPAFFGAALESSPVHIAQHASFLATALLFWWSVFERSRRHAGGASIASLFTTMAHSGALGALLAFAAHPWYAAYGGAYGMDALEDQQLGGLIMWAPASLAYLAAALFIASRWLRPSRRIADSPAT
jgi:putative membrane protein